MSKSFWKKAAAVAGTAVGAVAVATNPVTASAIAAAVIVKKLSDSSDKPPPPSAQMVGFSAQRLTIN